MSDFSVETLSLNGAGSDRAAGADTIFALVARLNGGRSMAGLGAGRSFRPLPSAARLMWGK
jgi:hypothetical protein